MNDQCFIVPELGVTVTIANVVAEQIARYATQAHPKETGGFYWANRDDGTSATVTRYAGQRIREQHADSSSWNEDAKTSDSAGNAERYLGDGITIQTLMLSQSSIRIDAFNHSDCIVLSEASCSCTATPNAGLLPFSVWTRLGTVT